LPPQFFFEDFDDGDFNGWFLSFSCMAVGICPSYDIVTSAAGNTPPSEPFWGVVGITKFTGGCLGNIGNGISRQFSVDSAGDYSVSADLAAFPCAGCSISARVFVDNQLVLQHTGQDIGIEPFNATKATSQKSETIFLSAGTHEIALGVFPSQMCSGSFRAGFDNVRIGGQVSTPTASLLSDMVGDPYFDVRIDQTSVNVARSSSVTIPLQINWLDGYESEPANIAIIGLNGTGITHSISSITDLQFEVVFDIPSDVQAGQHQFLVSVRDTELDDVVDTGITFNVE
jgi:hypothetical protein